MGGYLEQSFSEKIRSDVIILPGNWNFEEDRDQTPRRDAHSENLDSAFVDARKRWEKGPKAALEPLFTFHEKLTSKPCFSNMTPLLHYASAFYDATGPGFKDSSFERWNRAIDAGLLDFCEQVVSTDDVLSQVYQPWTIKFFEILESCFHAADVRCRQLPDTVPHSLLRTRIISIANQLWSIIIDRPHAFVCTHWEFALKGAYQMMLCRLLMTADAHMRFYFLCLSRLSETSAYMSSFSAMDSSGESSNGPEYGAFRRLVLFAWLHGHDPSDHDGIVESLLVMPYKDLWPEPFKTPLEIPEDEPAEFTSFIQDEILAVYGPRAFLDRLEISLRHPCNVNTRLIYLMKMIAKTILRHEFVPHVQAAGTLWSMRQAVDRQIMSGAKDDMQLFMLLHHTLIIFTLYSQISSVSEGAAYLVKECDVIELMSLTTVLAVRIQPLTPLGYTGLSVCLHPMQVWAELGRTLSMRSGRNSLLKAFKHSVRREWYPTLAALRTLPKEGLAVDADRDEFVQAWYELGMTVDLEEDKEREEYERFGKRAAQSCSWRECRYHSEPAPNPPRVCVGCGEVRYCGKPCQLKDWKQGQHKKRCKRIKDKPSVPRETARIYGLIQ
ncbi:hypothetical protein PENSPDRAFT_747573 [Peniophora sp. CONT]|nr:hypothetical protein PENSPDRAFT_747573 [Peniophora sp. CONT]